MLRPIFCALLLTFTSCEKDETSAPDPTGDAAATAGAEDDGATEEPGEVLMGVHLCCETRAGVDGMTLALSGCAKVEVAEAQACDDGGKFYADCDEATCTDSGCSCKEHHEAPADAPDADAPDAEAPAADAAAPA